MSTTESSSTETTRVSWGQSEIHEIQTPSKSDVKARWLNDRDLSRICNENRVTLERMRVGSNSTKPDSRRYCVRGLETYSLRGSIKRSTCMLDSKAVVFANRNLATRGFSNTLAQDYKRVSAPYAEEAAKRGSADEQAIQEYLTSDHTSKPFWFSLSKLGDSVRKKHRRKVKDYTKRQPVGAAA